MAEGIFDWDPQTGILISLAMILVSLMWWSARRRTRRATIDGRASAQAARHAARMERRATDDINELMVRLEELSREICGQIDTRFAKLEHVLKEADRTLTALRDAATEANAAPALQADATPAAAPPPAQAAPADPAHMRILELADKGAGPVEIARQVEMTVGEVELILSLERSRRTAAGSLLGPEAKPAASSGSRARSAAGRKKRPARRRSGPKKSDGPALDETA